MKPLKHFLTQKDGEKKVVDDHTKAVKKHSGPNGSKTFKYFHQGQLNKHKARMTNRERMKRATDI